MRQITFKPLCFIILLLLVVAGCTTEQAVDPELTEETLAQQGEQPNQTPLSKLGQGTKSIQGGIVPCELPDDFLGSGELGFWVCEGTQQVEDYISVYDLLDEADVAEHESVLSCSARFNWQGGLGTGRGSCPGADAGDILDYDRTFLVYTTGFGNGNCGSGGDCDRIVVRYEATPVDDDIWGVHNLGVFEEMDASGAGRYIDTSLPKKREFDVWYCEWLAEDECEEIGSKTNYTLDWNSVYVNKLGGTIPEWTSQPNLDIDIAGVLRGSTIIVYDSGH